MTEDQAKTKWCPFARASIVNADGAVGNRYDDGQPTPGALCIGAACMAWRWREPWTSQTEEGQGGDLVIRLARKPGEPKLGFCGLAGQP